MRSTTPTLAAHLQPRGGAAAAPGPTGAHPCPASPTPTKLSTPEEAAAGGAGAAEAEGASSSAPRSAAAGLAAGIPYSAHSPARGQGGIIGLCTHGWPGMGAAAAAAPAPRTRAQSLQRRQRRRGGRLQGGAVGHRPPLPCAAAAAALHLQQHAPQAEAQPQWRAQHAQHPKRLLAARHRLLGGHCGQPRHIVARATGAAGSITARRSTAHKKASIDAASVCFFKTKQNKGADHGDPRQAGRAPRVRSSDSAAWVPLKLTPGGLAARSPSPTPRVPPGAGVRR